MDDFLVPEEYSVDNIFKGRYLIPVYQRPYRWGDKQVNQLLEDIEEAFSGYDPEATESNPEDDVLFAGTVFMKFEKNVRNEYSVYTVVDGQQRITTITLLFMCILNKLYLEKSDDSAVTEIENYLYKKKKREKSKDLPVLELGNIDHEIMQGLFNELFAKRDIVSLAKSKCENSNNSIETNLLNNLVLIDNYVSNIAKKRNLLEYYDFVRFNVRVISITIMSDEAKLFNIFESINSKGMPLDEVDLIKNYIFQHLDQDDYKEYLDKWGNLIKQTNDNLNDYLTVYIRGNISYYKASIKLDNFETLSKGLFVSYFECNEENDHLAEVLKAVVDDMCDSVKYYNMLTDFELLKKNGVSDKSITFFRMNNLIKYEHTKALFFKLLSLRGDRLDDDKFDYIVEYASRFILTFQTVSSRESKQSSSVFSDIQNEIYEIAKTKNSIACIDDDLIKNIKYIINKKIYESTISDESIRTSIHNTMTFNKNKNAVKFLLAYLLEYESPNEIVDYSKINAILSLGPEIHVDHILPKAPKPSDNGYMYYQDDDFMILKQGQDFVVNPTRERIPIVDFLNEYLHRFGNLRLEWANDNIKKNNRLIKLEEFNDLFNTNQQIKDREEELINKIIESGFMISTNNYDFSPSDIKTKRREVVTSENYNDFEYKGYRPISFSLCESNVALNNYSYKQLLTELFDNLYELDRNRLVDLALEHYSLTRGKNPYISNTRSDIRNPFVLGDAVYIETNLSSEYAIRFAFKILVEMGLEESDLTITLEARS